MTYAQQVCKTDEQTYEAEEFQTDIKISQFESIPGYASKKEGDESKSSINSDNWATALTSPVEVEQEKVGNDECSRSSPSDSEANSEPLAAVGLGRQPDEVAMTTTVKIREKEDWNENQLLIRQNFLSDQGHQIFNNPRK